MHNEARVITQVDSKEGRFHRMDALDESGNYFSRTWTGEGTPAVDDIFVAAKDISAEMKAAGASKSVRPKDLNGLGVEHCSFYPIPL